MIAVEKVEAAEAASLASPSRARPGRALPNQAMQGLAVPCQDATSYHRKLSRVLAQTGNLYLLDDILTEIAEGKMQSFVEGNSWIITQIHTFPRAKALQVLIAIGDLDDLRVLHDRIIAFAAEIGAGVIQAHGRKGWLPDAARRGWKVKARYFIYQKEL